MSTIRFERTHPVFAVGDVVKAAEFYREQLGFHYDRFWGDPPCFVMLRRDGVEIFLRSPESGPVDVPTRPESDCEGWDVYVRVSDADALCEEFRSRGVKITRGPETAFYEMREFEVRDRDGKILCFAHDASGDHKS